VAVNPTAMGITRLRHKDLTQNPAAITDRTVCSCFTVDSSILAALILLSNESK